jgi:hypothetical protein
MWREFRTLPMRSFHEIVKNDQGRQLAKIPAHLETPSPKALNLGTHFRKI